MMFAMTNESRASGNQETVAYTTENITTEHPHSDVGCRSSACGIFSNCFWIFFMVVVAHSGKALSSNINHLSNLGVGLVDINGFCFITIATNFQIPY